jgi:hypothetical protein
MSDELFFGVMLQLQQINYSGLLRLNRYNEPLADREYALSRISTAKKYLPDCTLVIYTNCDYLNKEIVQDLVNAGVSVIEGTAHPSSTVQG